MRQHFPAIMKLAFWQLLLLVFAGSVTAQTTLDRLEQQIRQRVSPTREGSSSYRAPGAARAGSPQSSAIEPSPDAISAANNPMPVYLGVTADDRRDRGRGVRITDVSPGGPADRAGVKKQDLVIAVAGVRVRQLSDMTEILAVYQPSDVVEFDVVREGGRQTMKVTLARPVPTPAAAPQTAERIPLPPGEPILPDPGPVKTAPLLGQAAPTPASAVPPPPAADNSSSDRETSEQLRGRIAELEREVAELKQALSEAQKNNK